MNAELFFSAMDSLPVFDAHTHLVGEKLGASNFWEIVHYFWFLREMQGAGYPDPEADIPEAERVQRFVYAYQKTKGTGMHYAVERIFADLYGVTLTDAASVYAAMEAVADAAARPGWVASVAQRGHIVKTIINHEDHQNFIGLADTCLWAPRIDGKLHEAARRIFAAPEAQRTQTAQAEREALFTLLSGYHAKGITAVMTTLQAFDTRTYQNDGTHFAAFDDCLIYLLHAVCQFAEKHSLTVQFFAGVEHGYSSVAVPVNRTDRIVNLHGLFDAYQCRFDLVVASEVNNMDVVQAAQIYPNVYAGGMWWFNFRPSTYLDAMQKRFEALASVKSYLTISDARCIEWCYGKIMLIKKLAKDFFAQKVQEGYVTYGDALDIAADWFHNTAASLYTGREFEDIAP